MSPGHTHHDEHENAHAFVTIGGKFLSVRVAGHECDPHLHDTYSIALVRSGEAKCTIRNKTHTVVAGDVMIINPYEVSFGGCGDHTFEYDVLYPSCALMNDLLEFCDVTGGYPVFRDAVIGKCERAEQVFRSVDEYLTHLSGTNTHRHIELALGQLLRGRPLLSDDVEFTETSRDAIVLACELIRNEHRVPVDLASIAEQVGLSRYYFIRLFQKFTRLTPSAYLRQVRLSEARRLIVEGAELASAAAEAGFSDQAHMTRTFKQTFGFTPGQLKRGICATGSSESMH